MKIRDILSFCTASSRGARRIFQEPKYASFDDIVHSHDDPEPVEPFSGSFESNITVMSADDMARERHLAYLKLPRGELFVFVDILIYYR